MRVRLENVTRTYTTKTGITVNALSGLTMELEPAEFLAIVGPSGSGKTTLFNILGCLDTPTDGRLYFDGEEVSRLPEQRRILIRRRRIGYVFQAFNLVQTLTAFENASLPFWSEPLAIRQRRRKSLEALFESLEIATMSARFPRELSGGQEQRVAIARALANEPELVLADEPTGSLDPTTSMQLVEILRERSRTAKATVLVATHDYTLLPHFDRVVSLHPDWLKGIGDSVP